MSHARRTLAVLLATTSLLAAPAVAGAAEPTSRSRPEATGTIGSFEFQAGTYRPDVDSEFVLDPGEVGPWQKTFGTKRPWLFKVRGARALYSGFGTVELGLSAGYYTVTGSAFNLDGTPSPEKTAFKMVPLSFDVTYRLDVVWERYGVPVVPYGRVSFDRYNWWVTSAGGSTSKTGATNGYTFAGGLAFVLDVVDPTLAREIQRDSGIRHTMVFVETSKNKIDDFGSKNSWILSNDQVGLSFGFLFTF